MWHSPCVRSRGRNTGRGCAAREPEVHDRRAVLSAHQISAKPVWVQLETDVKLLDNGKGITWGFASGQFRTSSVLRITEKGDWTELAEITIGSQPPRKFMELNVSPQK